MRNFHDTSQIRKWSFISAFSICMTVRLNTRRSRNFLWVTAQKMKFSIKDFFRFFEFDGIKISLHYIKSRNFRLISWCGNFVETYNENFTIPQSFYTIKLGEITVSYAVLTVYKAQSRECIFKNYLDNVLKYTDNPF